MKKSLQILCKALGGSRAYGLETESSDTDIRGVFINTEVSKIIGLERFDHKDLRAGGDDEFYFELRHYLESLKNTNTQALELLFNEAWIEISETFRTIQSRKFELIDTEKLFKSLVGYTENERRLAFGERTGKLGGKRFETLQREGYSPKNVVQLFRLVHCGTRLFQNGYFPVNIRLDNPTLAETLFKIKTQPKEYSITELQDRINNALAKLKDAFDNRQYNYEFNANTANEICLRAYYPIIKEAYGVAK